MFTRSVRVGPMTTWFAMPWRATYRLGARIVLPIEHLLDRAPHEDPCTDV